MHSYRKHKLFNEASGTQFIDKRLYKKIAEFIGSEDDVSSYDGRDVLKILNPKYHYPDDRQYSFDTSEDKELIDGIKGVVDEHNNYGRRREDANVFMIPYVDIDYKNSTISIDNNRVEIYVYLKTPAGVGVKRNIENDYKKNVILAKNPEKFSLLEGKVEDLVLSLSRTNEDYYNSSSPTLYDVLYDSLDDSDVLKKVMSYEIEKGYSSGQDEARKLRDYLYSNEVSTDKLKSCYERLDTFYKKKMEERNKLNSESIKLKKLIVAQESTIRKLKEENSLLKSLIK